MRSRYEGRARQTDDCSRDGDGVRVSSPLPGAAALFRLPTRHITPPEERKKLIPQWSTALVVTRELELATADDERIVA